ncbi:MAG: hypothetical protein F6J90_26695 [Moorea sp. SIOASIH]|uniref:hypothetical protein n=1 Tax=Moorena sp. SIOASIH TaxID=2607817 RepID=UPI0013B60CF4|nr:hypothetical protein [Moorena sp. SIOASIH]NEO39723.1 hypothetical protein [Moorena sp. SIOASIH]
MAECLPCSINSSKGLQSKNSLNCCDINTKLIVRIFDWKFPTPDSRFPTPYSLLPAPCSLLPLQIILTSNG